MTNASISQAALLGGSSATSPIKAEGLTLAPLMTIEEAARLFRSSTKTVRRMIARGDLPAVRIKGQRAIRIRSVDALAVLRPIPSGAIGRE